MKSPNTQCRHLLCQEDVDAKLHRGAISVGCNRASRDVRAASASGRAALQQNEKRYSKGMSAVDTKAPRK